MGAAGRVVVQYIERRRLVELGFTSSLGAMPAETVDSILTVDARWRELEAKRADAERKKRGKR